MAKIEYMCCCLLFFSLPVITLSFRSNRGVLDSIVSTVNNVKTYFDTVKNVANLVSESLNKKTEQRREEVKTFKIGNEHSFLKHSLVEGFFRMLRLDSSKIIAIAVNSVIFLAQLISTLFDIKTNEKNPLGETKSRDDSTNWDPVKYILEHKNEKVKRLVEQAKDPDLPNQLINHVNGHDSSCVRLLMCKTSPIITAAQKSLTDKSVFKKPKMTSWLPTWKEFENNSDICEDRHTDCILFPN